MSEDTFMSITAYRIPFLSAAGRQLSRGLHKATLLAESAKCVQLVLLPTTIAKIQSL